MEQAARLHDTGHENRFPAVLRRHGFQVEAHVSEADIGLAKPHPYVCLRDLVTEMDKEGKIGSLILMGHKKADFRTFWENFHGQRPGHAVFKHHAGRLECCVPFMLHADEGVTRKKKALMVLSSHPVMGWGGRRSQTQDLNFVGNTFSTRFLFSVLLARLYTKKNKAHVLHQLVTLWSQDWRENFLRGIDTKSHGRLFSYP